MRSFEMAVAIDQHHGFKPFRQSLNCKLQSYTHLDNNILDIRQTNFSNSLKQAFEAANIHRSFSTPCLPLTTSVDEEFYSNPRIEVVGGHGAPTIRALVLEVARAMASGVDPLPVSSGLGGAYIFRSQNGNNIAVAKPADEEPLAFNNPKGFGGQMMGQPGLKRSVRIGETGIRELAAYLLDYGGFAGVPPTALVKLCHSAFHVSDEAAIPAIPSKIASLQCFVDHNFDAGELGPSCFSVASVHQIGILDLRLLNLDRHAGNMLVKKNDHESYTTGVYELVPIDHGFCLPEWLDDPYFEWLHWPQASVPFSESENEYISKLDPFEDAELLRTELPLLRESSVRVLVVCTIFLKRAAAAGLCLADIGAMMTQEFCGGEETLSELETICSQAKANLRCIPFINGKHSEETENEFKMFQFDGETKDYVCKVFDLPSRLQIHHEVPQPSKLLRFSSAGSINRLAEPVLSPLYEENYNENKDVFTENTKDNDGSNDKCDKHVEGGMVKSMSFSVQNWNCETGGVSFGDMNGVEWELFLEMFEKLLLDVFEDKRSMKLKQRSTSCKF